MENYQYFYTANTSIYVIASLIIISACILLYSKLKSTATIIILIGSVLAFVFNLGNIIISLIAGQFDIDTYFLINAIIGILNGLAYALFCVGLLLFVVNDLNTEEPKDEFLDN